jgi:hypothetical protein
VWNYRKDRKKRRKMEKKKENCSILVNCGIAEYCNTPFDEREGKK